MRKVLDKMFGNKKTSIFVPLLTAAVVYLLFVLFTLTDDKTNMIIMTPIVCAIWFFGVFFIIYIQIKNAACPEWLLNLFELLVTVIFGVYALFGIVSFVISGLQSFNPGLCLGPVTYSAVSLAHNKRREN